MNDIFINTTTHSSRYTGQDISVTDFMHLFIIDVTCYSQINDYELVLQTDEIAKAKRFLQQEDRENFIIRKHLLRLLLGRLLNIPPAEINYRYGPSKKPYLDGINFNVSHTKDVALIAISSEEIGVDIEYINSAFDFNEIMPYCFNEAETAFILNSNSPLLNFYTLWTRKEAILKATGEGLTDKLSEVPTMENTIIRNQYLWQLKSFKINEDVLASIAVQPDARPTLFWTYP